VKFWVSALCEAPIELMAGEIEAGNFEDAMAQVRQMMRERFAGPGRITTITEWPDKPTSLLTSMCSWASGEVHAEAMANRRRAGA